MAGVVTLLTDFGTADGYVAEMKGVLLTDAPGTSLVDIAHDLVAHDVELARLTLARYWRRFPAGTVHLAVVDPGVGSDRAAIAVESAGRRLVGPDNGLLSPALLLPAARVVRLPVPASAAATFHGRDVFAPAAARLARGESVESLGEPFRDATIRRTPEARRGANGDLEGVILAVDRFGNAITNLVGARGTTLLVLGRELRLCRTYADFDPGEMGAIVGSSGLVEVAMRDGSAADALGIRRGTPVALR
jgi:S-adenosyl-L-methionine hydrolase (adenosine-forming)